jgi:hypothetical protein
VARSVDNHSAIHNDYQMTLQFHPNRTRNRTRVDLLSPEVPSSTRTFLHPTIYPICMQIGCQSDSLSDFPSDTNQPLSTKLSTNLFFWPSFKFRETLQQLSVPRQYGIGQIIGYGIGWKIMFVCRRTLDFHVGQRI